MTKGFNVPVPQDALDLVGKARSNIFPWRGQFSPELIEVIFDSYCREGSIVIDPFCGSGTVLCEAGRHGLEALGVELNPAAYILSRTYELINLSPIDTRNVLDSFSSKVQEKFSKTGAFSNGKALPYREFRHCIRGLQDGMTKEESILLGTLVILLDISNEIDLLSIHSSLHRVTSSVRRFPHSTKQISVLFGDSRCIPIEDGLVDFCITSPPYINVFNYHQNYRRSAESLGWDLLKIARSEIGSNRANRGNRFLTVVQYCLDMVDTLAELHRVTKNRGKIILVVGYESNVMGVPFFNAEIVLMLAVRSGLFNLVLRQSRRFKNKFGKVIREDLLHLESRSRLKPETDKYAIAKAVAAEALIQGMKIVQPKNREFLIKAIDSVSNSRGTPIYQSKKTTGAQ